MEHIPITTEQVRDLILDQSLTGEEIHRRTGRDMQHGVMNEKEVMKPDTSIDMNPETDASMRLLLRRISSMRPNYDVIVKKFPVAENTSLRSLTETEKHMLEGIRVGIVNTSNALNSILKIAKGKVATAMKEEGISVTHQQWMDADKAVLQKLGASADVDERTEQLPSSPTYFASTKGPIEGNDEPTRIIRGTY